MTEAAVIEALMARLGEMWTVTLAGTVVGLLFGFFAFVVLVTLAQNCSQDSNSSSGRLSGGAYGGYRSGGSHK